MSLEDKLKQPAEATRRGERSREELIADLEKEMEVLRGHHERAPKTEAGKQWREALEIYFEALEYAIDLARENRLGEQEEWDNVYAICAEADDLMDELERA
jgi:hypothetical protein